MCLQRWSVETGTAGDILEAYQQQFSLYKDAMVIEGWIAICCSVVCAVWLARKNKKIFRDNATNVVEDFELAQLRPFYWIIGKSKERRFNFNEWLLEPKYPELEEMIGRVLITLTLSW